ncbi:hypothetical protein KI688_005900 [Linnemannia hyalina]|uniref:Uncharacterized protein n=1 Tax=Linnemannia hyalina TaxID=64524 RepID=A0A9P7Y2T0_9FUNG|nr:hypothetical protein KI688_005900 [Linnemannia hyalina]
MESPSSSLTFNALQERPIPETHSANHDLARIIARKWEIYAGHREQYHTSSMDDDCFFLQKNEGDNLEKIVFQSDIYADFETRGMSNPWERIPFKAIGSPMCLYRLACTFPSGVRIVQTDKSAWWSGFIHKATGRYFGITDMKGRPALRTVQEESDLRSLFMEDGQWQLFKDLSGVCNSVGKTISRTHLEELPKELVDHLSDPNTGDVVVLKKMQDFVDTNNIFTSDIAELLGYLASDQCAHGYGDLVAGCEEREP